MTNLANMEFIEKSFSFNTSPADVRMVLTDIDPFSIFRYPLLALRNLSVYNLVRLAAISDICHFLVSLEFYRPNFVIVIGPIFSWKYILFQFSNENLKLRN